MNINTDIEKQLDQHQVEIHIKIQKRNGRKSWTYVEGLEKIELPENVDREVFMTDLTKKLKKKFNCGVTLQENVFALNGDHREKMKEYLIQTNLIQADKIIIHGF